MSCAPGKIASPSKEKTPKLRFRMREPEKRTPVVFEVRESRHRQVEVLDAAAGSFERLLPSVENYSAAAEGPCVGKAIAEGETDQPWSWWPGLSSGKGEGDGYDHADAEADGCDRGARPAEGL